MVDGNSFRILGPFTHYEVNFFKKMHSFSSWVVVNRKYCTTIVQNPMELICHPLKIHAAELFVEV